MSELNEMVIKNEQLLLIENPHNTDDERIRLIDLSESLLDKGFTIDWTSKRFYAVRYMVEDATHGQ